jgi:hypothetical protein
MVNVPETRRIYIEVLRTPIYGDFVRDVTVARLQSTCKMYCVRVSLRTGKLFLAQHYSKKKGVVGNLYISLVKSQMALLTLYNGLY